MNNTTTISRAFNQAARWQFIATALVAILAFVLGGMPAALSAIGGGGAAILGGYAAAAMTRGRQAGTAGTALLTLLKAEAIKIGVIALVLLIIFKFYKELVPLALIGGLACAALISGAALRAFEETENK